KLTTAYTRRIFYFRPAADKATGTLGNFNSTGTDALTADELALFAGACSKTDVSARLFQCAGADSGKLTTLNSAANMVSYLRGQPVTGMRSRSQILGDVVNSSPVFVGKPSFSYKENGYATWAAEKPQVDRTRILLVGGNDGMLHAFRDSDGTEAWAYVPRLVMDKMYKLADDNYRIKHQYFVDGTVTVADVWDPTAGTIGASGPSGAWRTIVVGGLGAGGRGFYALDITDTDNPKALWELGPDQMPSGASGQLGLSMGNPIVTKRADGSWIVALTSGYNNPTAGGYLFIVNALTGEVVKTIPTEDGGSNVGEGLTKINAWVESTSANLALRFYGGDLKGQLWRFDVDNLVEPKGKALLLASFKSGESPRVAQPITTMPMLAEFSANGGKRRVIYVGTGKYLGEPDVPSTTYPEHQQSIYAVVDELTSTGLGDVRGTTGALVQQTIDKSVSPYVVGSTSTPVDWSKNKGWFVDLGLVKERVNIDMMMVANTLVAVGNVPGASSTLCSAPDANSAYLYMFNIMTGTGKVLATGSMVAGLSATEDPPVDGVPPGTISGLITTTKSGIVQPPISVMTLSGQKPHRTSWRELY
ncbi:MAG TPA: PilC/PilY family type IV pilus protein, partial [Burkholderiaceae bacterium]|nr:PilC/PilY family type IV pilus protein [Burkholderiaceae bacterium]